ncbi:MAG: nodulation protein NodH [Candidatus Saccharibacteria bacterium]|nr:nodulation protein NodH [Pseudorhodobacter sp.]
MAKPKFQSFVVFAEMRTGSNFLESNLNAIAGVTCHGEAFNPYFLGGDGKTELLGMTLDQRNANPALLLRILRDKTEGIGGFRYFHDHDPRVFDLVVDDPLVAKIILTRNQLECYISWKIAQESDQWWLANTKHLKTVRPTFDVEEFKSRLDVLQAFQLRLLNRLQVTGQTAYYIDYDDILDLKIINGLAAFLGAEARLEDLVFKFKKQNPEPIAEKVANPAEMAAGLAQLDWFNMNHSPNFEPRRPGSVGSYVASDTVGLLFQPVKSGPEQRIRRWLQGYGGLITSFDRQSLRKWREAHAGQRSFTVLRHPLARAYAAWCDFLEKEWMPELRPYLKRVHRFELPPKAQEGFQTADEHRAGFLVFLELIKHLHAGRTELRTPPQLATQLATVSGFATVQAPDFVLREDRLAEGLTFVCANAGVQMMPLADQTDGYPFDLATIYDAAVEAAAREAYGRDYTAYGFGNWQP